MKSLFFVALTISSAMPALAYAQCNEGPGYHQYYAGFTVIKLKDKIKELEDRVTMEGELGKISGHIDADKLRDLAEAIQEARDNESRSFADYRASGGQIASAERLNRLVDPCSEAATAEDADTRRREGGGPGETAMVMNIISNCPKPEYPATARHAQVTGVSRARVAIADDGQVSVTIIAGSGPTREHELLDKTYQAFLSSCLNAGMPSVVAVSPPHGLKHEISAQYEWKLE